MMNGNVARCGSSWIAVVVVGGKEFLLDCLVSTLAPGHGMLLGMDAINVLGGVCVNNGGMSVQFGPFPLACAVVSSMTSSVKLEDQDFSAVFNDGKWIVRYKWSDDNHNPVLHNNRAQYKICS